MRSLFRRDSDPFSHARYSSGPNDIMPSRPKRIRHWWQWSLLSVFFLIILLAGFGLYKYYSTQAKIHRGGPEVDSAGEGEPFNVLLVGSDSRGDLTAKEQERLGARAVSGQRADTLILGHVDPASDRVIMVQFPRDLYVPIAGGGRDKINSALLGGPEQLVRTVRRLTGLEINKYVEVNIAGFRDLVDAIGGVEVCITEPIPFDPQTGIEIKPSEVGMVYFPGDRALRFVRSRAFETGDFERIRNQQKFLSAAIAKVTSSQTIFRPDRILELLDVAGENLRTDVNTTINGLRELVARFRSFDPERYEAYTVPNLGIGAADGASIVIPYEDGMDLMFEAIAKNRSPADFDGVPEIDPSEISVGVYNAASAERPVAAETAAALEEATDPAGGEVEHVRIVEIGDARKKGETKTVIRYRSGDVDAARFVAAAIPSAEMAEGRTPRGVDVAVLVGSNPLDIERVVQLTPIEIPPPSDLPRECT